MKIKNIFFVTVILLAILTVGAVSAEENMTSDELTVEDVSNDDVLEINEKDVLEKEDPVINVSVPEKIYVYGEDNFEDMDINLPEDVESDTYVYFDEKEFTRFSWDSESIRLYEIFDFIGGYGEHTWKVKFLGDDKYDPVSKEGKFVFTPIKFDFPGDIDDNYVVSDIYAPKNANGYVKLIINGKQVFNGKFEEDEDISYDEYAWMRLSSDIGIDEKAFGNYSYEIIYYKDSELGEWRENGTFEYHYRFDISYDNDIDIGKESRLDIALPYDVTGKVDITVDGVTRTLNAESYIYETIEGLTLFNHTVTVRYYGGNYEEKSKTFVINVNPLFEIDTNVNFKENASVILIMNKDAKGKLIVKIDDEIVASANFVDGVANATLPILRIGSYEVICHYSGDDYSIKDYDEYIRVDPIISVPEMRVGDNKYLEIEYPSDATGDLTILIDDVRKEVEFKNGKAKVPLSYLDVNEDGWSLEITYENGNYPYFEDYNSIVVNKLLPKITLNCPEVVSVGEKVAFTFTLPKDATGEMQVILLVDGIYGEEWDVGYGEIKSGKATVYITPSKAGTWVANYYFGGDEKYDSVSEAVNMTVVPAGKVTAKDLTMSYSDGSKYTVTVYNSEGKTVGKGQLVTFYAGSKKIGTVYTDSNGKASLKITLTPGNYKIKAVSKGAKVTKNLKVKQILTVKKVTVKKSAKKLVLTATLSKVNKKYLKGKTITFKFNGKSYKAKTDKKGVAKVTIKKSVLKKLKVGKKITYQATYLKDTVKKSVKVKK